MPVLKERWQFKKLDVVCGIWLTYSTIFRVVFYNRILYQQMWSPTGVREEASLAQCPPGHLLLKKIARILVLVFLLELCDPSSI